jgi:hypothetical protein
MEQLDRVTARALVEAGYMPLDHYIERFGEEVRHEAKLVSSPSAVPDDHPVEPALQRAQ